MTANQLTQHRSSLPPQLAILTSFSLLPIFALTRFRWNARLGLDPLHLVLIQLLFTLFVYQRFSPPPSDIPSKSTPRLDQQEEKISQDRDHEEGKNQTSSLDTSAGVAESLKKLLENPTDWINVFPTPGLEILQHRSKTSLYAVRTEIEDGNVTLEQLVRCIQESKQWEWDRMCECGEDLGDGVTWLRLKGFWPIKPKEIIVRSGIFRLPSSEVSGVHRSEDLLSPIRILAATSSTTHPLKTSTLEIKFAGYLIEQVPSCSGFQVTQIVDLSGFGPLPTFVTKAILRKFIPSSLKKLVTLAHRIQPLSTPQGPKEGPPSWMPPTLKGTVGSHSSCTPTSKQNSNDQESLRPILEELKKMVDTLRLQQQQNGTKPYPRDTPLASSKTLKLISLLGTSSLVVFCLSSVVYKSNPGFIKRIRDKVLQINPFSTRRNTQSRFKGTSEEIIVLLDFFSKLKD